MILDKKIALSILQLNLDRIIQETKLREPDENDWEEFESLLKTEDKPKYVFTDSVINSLNTIRIKDDFDCNILNQRKIADAVFILSRVELFVTATLGDNVRVFHFIFGEEPDGSTIEIFTFRLTENKTIVAPNISADVWKSFLRCAIYLEFLPVNLKLLKQGEKSGTRKTGKFINKTKFDFTLVTKAWNQKYVTLDGVKFLSRAHWGIRWTGVGRTEAKLVWIKSSLKERTVEAPSSKL